MCCGHNNNISVGIPIDISTLIYTMYVNGFIAICPIVHGFSRAVYSVMEEEILNTRFELNVKGMKNFSGLLNIQGTITSVAGGTASEYYSSMCPSLQHNN